MLPGGSRLLRVCVPAHLNQRQSQGGDKISARVCGISPAVQVGKPVLKLTDDDYSEHSLQAGC